MQNKINSECSLLCFWWRMEYSKAVCWLHFAQHDVFFMRTHDFHKYHSEADTAKMCWWCQHNVWWILITHIFNGEFLVGQKEKLEGYSKSQGKTKHALTYETTEYLVLRSYYLRRITKEKPGLHGWPWWLLRQNNGRRLGGTVTSHVPLAWPRWFCKSLLNGQEEVTGREKGGKATSRTEPVSALQISKDRWRQVELDWNNITVVSGTTAII